MSDYPWQRGEPIPRSLDEALCILKKIRDCCERHTGARRFKITNDIGFQEAMLISEELLQRYRRVP